MSSVVISGDTSGAVTISAPAVAGTTTLTLPAISGTILQSGTTVTEAQGGTGTTTGYYGFKNRIINGAMVIDQRNAGASGTLAAYTVDRWGYYGSQASKVTWQQNAGAVTPPTGFSNYLGVTSSSAYSVLTTDQFYLYQRIEGLNTADLSFGSASAAYVTLSFWVRSSLTGTFGGVLTNSAANRTYPFSYTISVANTWEQKSVTIAGDTTGTWLTTSGTGIGVGFNLGTGATYSATANTWTATSFVTAPTGATSVVGTNGATWYVTGVQLEKGSTATSFDYRPYGTELSLCQRYCQVIRSTSANIFLANGFCYSSAAALVSYVYPVTPRVPATGVTVNAASNFACFLSNTSSTNVVTFGFNTASPVGVTLQPQGMSGLVAGNATQMIMNASAVIEFTGMEL